MLLNRRAIAAGVKGLVVVDDDGATLIVGKSHS